MLIKYCAVIGSVLVSSYVMAGTLTTYEEITANLNAGKTVLVNIDASKCKTRSGDASDLKRLAIKFNDLSEFQTSYLNDKKMRATAVQETGLWGDKQFIWYRSLTILLEDNTVAYITDVVDPTNYSLIKRADILCKLTADNSGGVRATVL